MTTPNGAPRAPNFELPYITCRNISGPEDDAAKRKVYAGHAPTSSVLALEDDQNVREYLVDAQATSKSQSTLAHRAIRKILADQPDQFSILNGGMVIVARAAEVDDKRKVLLLERPGIINGWQTHDELTRYFENQRQGEDFYRPSIKYELIVTADEDVIAEISLSRNFQSDALAMSVMRRDELDGIEHAIQQAIPGAKLYKSDPDAPADSVIDTEKLFQVLFALMPKELFDLLNGDTAGKVVAYSHKARCLRLLRRALRSDSNRQTIYSYFRDMAGHGWTEYQKWKRQIETDPPGEVVPDGFVFPILSALSEFVVRTRRSGSEPRWGLRPVMRFDEKELLEAALQVYEEIAGGDAQAMGRNKACYSALQRITSIYARLDVPEVPFNPAFLKNVDELELSVHSANCLKNDNIVYIGDLVQKTEAEILRTPNFSRKSFNEIREVLAHMGLHLGMEVPGWPPDDIDELAKRFEDHY